MTTYHHRLKPIHQLFACLIATDRHQEVEDLVKKHINGENEAEIGYYLSLAYAGQEKAEDALSEIKKVLEKKPDNESAKRLAFKILIHQARSRIKENDYKGLSSVLGDALEIAPNDPELDKEIAGFKGILPLSYLKAGSREDAARIWEEELKQNPQDHRVIHNLALLYYWWALDAENCSEKDSKKTNKIDFLWKRAIAYWVMLMNTENFWKEWKKEREGLCSIKIKEEDIKKLKNKLIDDRFNKVFHDYVDQHKQNGRQKDSARHEDYLTTLMLEKKTASYYKEALNRVKKLGIKTDGAMKRWELIRAIQEKEGNAPCFATVKGECKDMDTCYWGESCIIDPSLWNKTIFLSIACGPMIFKEMDVLSEVHKLIELSCKAGGVNEKLSKLMIYLSPLGKALILIDDLKRPQRAIDKWDKLPQDVKDSVKGRYIYALARVESGKGFLQKGDIDKALNNWSDAKLCVTKAIKTATDSSLDELLVPLKDKIDDLAVDVCEREAKRLEQKDKIDDAIKMLTIGLKIVDRKSLKEHLAVFYCNRGIKKLNDKKLNDKKFSAARNDFETALSYDSNNKRAKQSIGTTYNNEGVAKSDTDKAIPLFEKAIKYDPDSDVTKQNLAGAYNGKAVSILNSLNEYSSSYDCDEAIALLKKAAKLLNPSIGQDILNAIEYAGDQIDSGINNMDDSLYKTVLKNLAVAGNYRRQLSRW